MSLRNNRRFGKEIARRLAKESKEKRILKEKRAKQKVSHKHFTPNPQEEEDRKDDEYEAYLELAYEQRRSWIVKERELDPYDDTYDSCYAHYELLGECSHKDSSWTPWGFGCNDCGVVW